jgi:hypothetical protein
MHKYRFIAGFVDCIGEFFDQLSVPLERITELICGYTFSRQAFDIDQHRYCAVLPFDHCLPGGIDAILNSNRDLRILLRSFATLLGAAGRHPWGVTGPEGSR